MKVIKPQKLGLLTRTFEHKQQPYLVTTILAFFPLHARALLPEVALWKTMATELGKDAALDLGMPKARPELLITGKAFSPGGQPRPAFSVRARIGAIDKTLYIVGDRHWKYRIASDPAPLTELPLTYANAFGGAGYALNPAGKGFNAPEERDALHLLPNIEDPKNLISSPRDRPAPAGFGPYDFMWPQRYDKLGTYDQAWLEDGFPGFASDMSLGAFNAAPDDQQLSGAFRDDEAFVLENLHPDRPTIEGRLPGLIARCFANQKSPGGEVFHEVPLRLETVHLFPPLMRGILLFRGMIEVADEEGDDVLQLVVAGEEAGAPRPVEHYQTVLAQRLDRKKGHLFALRDGDLLPPLDAAPVLEGGPKDDIAEMNALLASEGLVQKNMRRRMELERERAREQVRAQGLDPDRHVPALPPEEPPPDLDHLGETVERAMALAEEQKLLAEEHRKKAEDEARRQCAAHGLDYDKLVADERKKAGGPPKFSAKAQMDHLHETLEMARNAGVDLPHVEEQLGDPELERKLVATERQLREAYVKFAHHFPEAASLEPEASRSLRASIALDHEAGQSFAGRDLTGADLAGIQLEGADFRGAMMENVNLTDANLRGVDFTGAVLARADLTGADFTGAKLAYANLGAATLRRVSAGGGVDFSRAVLAKADLTDADLSGAKLDGADLSEATFTGTDLRGATAPGMNLLNANLTGAKLCGANLSKCNFLEVDVSGVDFSGADLTSAVFLGAKGDGAVFHNAKLDNLRVVRGSSFAGANFSGASLERANLRGTTLAGSDFTGARLSESDLCECDLRGATFYLAVAVGARFVKADLTGADMFSANLMDAILQRAKVHGTTFEGANLFGADLFRIRVDGGTILKDAELGRARFVEARSTHEQG
jgi:uncharacterized protein YjbI with pentapeptide repeats